MYQSDVYSKPSYEPLPPQQTLPTMYDLPSEDPEEPGLPDEFHLLQPEVNETRFLALVLLIVIAYSLATMHGQRMKKLGIETYAGRIQQHQDKYPRQSDFSFSLYGQLWIYGMELWCDS